MAFFTKDRDRSARMPEPQPPPRPVVADPAPEEVAMVDRDAGAVRAGDGALTAFLGKGTRITGTLVFEGPCRIEGHVEGEVAAKDTLTVGEGAVVDARLDGATIVVHGTVRGDVVAATRLELHAPGKVIGDVTTPRLVVHEGAILEGRCSMSKAAEATRGATPASSAAPASVAAPAQSHAG